jgi:hypothetical protein
MCSQKILLIILVLILYHDIFDKSGNNYDLTRLGYLRSECNLFVSFTQYKYMDTY